MSSPGRRLRRAQRFGAPAPTRMSEYQRHRQAETGSCRGVFDHLGIIDDIIIDEGEEAVVEDRDDAAAPAGQPDYTRPLADRESTAFEFAVLSALQSKPVYQQSVPADEVQRRRDRNRAARKARRNQRQAVAR